MNERLQAIEKRCEARGWLWGNFHQGIFDIALAIGPPRYKRYGDHESKEFRDFFYKVADNIFAMYEPGLIVKVDKDKDCQYCGIDEWKCTVTESTPCGFKKKGSACPGAGTFKLVEVDDGDV